MSAREEASIELLEGFKWAFMILDFATRYRLKRRIERLSLRPRPHEAHLVAGTSHVYRLWAQGVRILYHYREGRITLLALSVHRSERQVDELLVRRKITREAQRGSSGSGRGTHGGGTRSRKAESPA
jgi:mRNA-degrading endonuclease RelE of RelBE toxin-antitoxin system